MVQINTGKKRQLGIVFRRCEEKRVQVGKCRVRRRRCACVTYSLLAFQRVVVLDRFPISRSRRLMLLCACVEHFKKKVAGRFFFFPRRRERIRHDSVSPRLKLWKGNRARYIYIAYVRKYISLVLHARFERFLTL